MQPYQHQFLQFAVDAGVLRFGTFTLKSGRRSPYFFDAGLFDTGAQLARLGDFYGRAILTGGIRFDMLFGPAYKGIVLVSAVSIALATGHGLDMPYAFNRKEIKDHGEGGSIVGAPLRGDVLIVDDVISAGTSVGESVRLIRGAGARPAGVVIALDRQERGQGAASAVGEVEQTYGIPVKAIARLDDLLGYLASQPESTAIREEIQAYRERYGVPEGSSFGCVDRRGPPGRCVPRCRIVAPLCLGINYLGRRLGYRAAPRNLDMKNPPNPEPPT